MGVSAKGAKDTHGEGHVAHAWGEGSILYGGLESDRSMSGKAVSVGSIRAVCVCGAGWVKRFHVDDGIAAWSVEANKDDIGLLRQGTARASHECFHPSSGSLSIDISRANSSACETSKCVASGIMGEGGTAHAVGAGDEVSAIIANARVAAGGGTGAADRWVVG